MLLIPEPKAGGCIKDNAAVLPLCDSVKKWAW